MAKNCTPGSQFPFGVDFMSHIVRASISHGCLRMRRITRIPPPTSFEDPGGAAPKDKSNGTHGKKLPTFVNRQPNKNREMNHLDHLSNRVVLGTVVGGTYGYLTAMARGHYLGRSTVLTAASCAMTGTICFGIERLAFVAIQASPIEATRDIPRLYVLLATHTIGGTLGGALLGAVYNRRPINGMFALMPLMFLIGYGESKFQDLVDEKQRIARLRQQY